MAGLRSPQTTAAVRGSGLRTYCEVVTLPFMQYMLCTVRSVPIEEFILVILDLSKAIYEYVVFRHHVEEYFISYMMHQSGVERASERASGFRDVPPRCLIHKKLALCQSINQHDCNSSTLSSWVQTAILHV